MVLAGGMVDGQVAQIRTNVPARGKRYSPEQRQQVVSDALARTVDGDTLADIAADHGVTVQTLHAWLSATGDEYRELRQAWLDSMLARGAVAIDASTDQFELARAREQWKYATWYAERRDPARYGARQDPSTVVQVAGNATITPAMDQAEAARLYQEMIGGQK